MFRNPVLHAILCVALGAAAALAQTVISARSPRDQARHLLEAAAESAGTAQPECYVISVMHIGEVWRTLDQRKAVDFLRLAFAAAAALPADDDRNTRGVLQGRIVERLAEIDPASAAELVRAMPEPRDPAPRSAAIDKVIQAFLGKEDVAHAIEVVGLAASASEYPYGAAQHIFEKLAPEDARRTVVFGNALAAYNRHSAGPFAAMLARHWREIPRQVADSALEAVVGHILEIKEDPAEGQSYATLDGSVQLGNRQSIELYEIMPVLRALDPKEASEILEKRADLRAAVERHPDGAPAGAGTQTSRRTAEGSSWNETRSSGGDDEEMPSLAGLYGGDADPNAMVERMRRWGESSEKAAAALAALNKDPDKALDLVPEIPIPGQQAGVLARIAQALAGKDADAARGALERATTLLESLKVPGDRVMAWVEVAETAHRLKDGKTAWEAFERALADVADVYRRDSDAKMPNLSMREAWPSVVACRLVAWRAGKLLGGRAEALLEGVAEPDLAVLARIEMARALLDQPLEIHEVSINYAQVQK